MKNNVNYLSLLMLYVASMFISALIMSFLIVLGITDSYLSAVVAQAIGQIISIILFVMMDLSSIKSSLRDFGKNIKKALLLCAGLYILALIGTMIITPHLNNLIEFVAQLFREGAAIPDSSENQGTIVDTLNSGNLITVIFMMLLVTVLAPIFEELIFRKALIGLFATYFKLKWVGYVLSVILFAAIHVVFAGDYISIGPYLVSGAAFAGIYWYTKENIVYPIVIHMIWNIVVSIIIFNS